MNAEKKANNEIVLEQAQTPQDFSAGVHLFKQYADSLQIDLSFQDFIAELQTINQHYGPPAGALLIAYHQQTAVGCVALRALDQETAELKRLFVQPIYQGHQIGQRLMCKIIDIAKNLQYKRIRLDTLSTMESALKLYRRFGFYETPPYRFNPIEGAIYMEKKLTEANTFTS